MKPQRQGGAKIKGSIVISEIWQSELFPAQQQRWWTNDEFYY